jgi:hypothetical protein
MSTNANALANLLYSYTFQQDGVTPVSVANASSSEQQWLALAITQAIQEMHGIKPDAWRERPGITLSAPITGTATVTFGSTACTLGTLTVPNDGCTVRFSSGIDNELNSNGSGGYVLRRPHDGDSATLWQDCWVAADGTQYENVLGEPAQPEAAARSHPTARQIVERMNALRAERDAAGHHFEVGKVTALNDEIMEQEGRKRKNAG